MVPKYLLKKRKYLWNNRNLNYKLIKKNEEMNANQAKAAKKKCYAKC